MQLTENQKHLYQLGEKARILINNDNVSLKVAVRILAEEYAWNIEEIQYSKDRFFFEAGYDNFEPQWRKAARYGEIPKNGYSINHATGEVEKGVSCIKLLTDNETDCKSIYDITLGLQGIEKILIEGWYLGNSGSDGEPLLLNAIKIE